MRLGLLLLALAALAAPARSQESLVELAKFHFPVPPALLQQMVTGDFDGDGDPDALRFGAVFENDGHARFSPRGRLPGVTSPQRVITADADGDGDDDVVVLDRTGGLILFSNGRFGFTTDPRGPFASQPLQPILVADVDGDGRDDFVAASGQTSPPSLWIADPAAGFRAVPFPPVSIVPWSNQAHAFDADGDGDVDVLAGATLMLNDGSGNFVIDADAVTSGLAGIPYGLTIGDVDGDRDVDALLMTVNATELLINERGSFVGRPFAIPGRPSWSPFAALVDADGDGRAELVWGSDQPELYTNLLATPWLVPGAMPDTERQMIGDLIVEDLDGDGFADLHGFYTAIWLADGRGAFRSASLRPAVPATGTDGRAVHADLDGDGDVDFLGLTQRYGARLLLNRGDGTFDEAPASAVPSIPDEVFFATGGDLDADGDVDLYVVTSGRSNLPTPDLVLVNDGSAHFTVASGRLPTPTDFVGWALPFDLDRDGDVDLIRSVSDATTHQYDIELLVNDGRGGFRQRVVLLPGAWGLVAPADLDGDGDYDLMHAGQDVEAWFRDSNGNYGGRIRVVWSSGADDMEFADVDGDGDLDFLHGARHRMGLHLNDGTGRFTNVTGSRVPSTIQRLFGNLAVGDVDEDGDPDVVCGMYLLENQSGYFVRTSRLLAVHEWTEIYASGGPDRLVDIDGDGDLDLFGYDGHILQNLHRHVHTPFLARPGRPFVFRVSCRPGYLGSDAAAIGVIGFRSAHVPLGALGTLRVDPALSSSVQTIPATTGSVDLEVVLPNDPRALGVALHAQFLVLPPGSPPRLTNAVVDVIR